MCSFLRFSIRHAPRRYLRRLFYDDACRLSPLRGKTARKMPRLGSIPARYRRISAITHDARVAFSRLTGKILHTMPMVTFHAGMSTMPMAFGRSRAISPGALMFRHFLMPSAGMRFILSVAYILRRDVSSILQHVENADKSCCHLSSIPPPSRPRYSALRVAFDYCRLPPIPPPWPAFRHARRPPFDGDTRARC